MIAEIILDKAKSILFSIFFLVCVSFAMESAKAAEFTVEQNETPVQIPNEDEKTISMPLFAIITERFCFETKFQKMVIEKFFWKISAGYTSSVSQPHLMRRKILPPNKIYSKPTR